MKGTLADDFHAAIVQPSRMVGGDLYFRRFVEANPFMKRSVEMARRGAIQHIRSAHRFVMDRSAVELASDIAWLPPHRLVKTFRRIRPPFGNMWIEWDEADRGRAYAEHRDGYEGMDARRVGLHITEEQDDNGFTITVVSDTPALGGISCHPISITATPHKPINRNGWMHDMIPDTLRHTDDIDGATLIALGPEYVRHWLGGIAPEDWDTTTPDSAAITAMIRNAGATFTVLNAHGSLAIVRRGNDPEMAQDYVRSQLQAIAGDYRFAIGVLGILCWTSAYGHDPATRQPSGRRVVAGRPIPWLAHKVLSLKVPRPKGRAVFETGRWHSAVSRHRRHSVMGHYVDDWRQPPAASCAHDFVPTERASGVPEMTCTKCKGRIWWRAEHERGDARLGYTQKTYDVTAA